MTESLCSESTDHLPGKQKRPAQRTLFRSNVCWNEKVAVTLRFERDCSTASTTTLGRMAQAEQHSPKRRDARVVEWTALEMRHTGDCIQGSNPCLSAQASAAVGSIQPAALLFSTHLSISQNTPTEPPQPTAPSFTVPSPRHFHSGLPHQPHHWFSQKNVEIRTREGTEPRSRRHRPAQEKTKGPHNKTHRTAQQKALARMTQKH